MTEQQRLIPIGSGTLLKQERVKRGLSIEDMAGALHIPVDVLEAIEADEMHRYASVYQRGYVRAYARQLGMEDEQVGQLLSGVSQESPELHSVFPQGAKLNHADRWLRAAGYVLASLLIGTLAWQFTHEAVRLSQPDQDIAAGDTAATVAPARQDRARTPPTHINASIASLEPVRAQNRADRPAAGEQAWTALQHAAAPGSRSENLANGEHILVLATSADSWIEIVDAGGRQLELDLVRGGSEKRYRGTAPFRILLGRASAVELYMDGNLVDTESFTRGDVAQMTLDVTPQPDGSQTGSGG